jgi:hypothetical protein
MPYMTPLQSATESSTTPKSVMKTTVGGGWGTDGCARTALAARSKKTNHRQNIRADFAGGVNVIRMKLQPSEKTTILLGI